MEQVKSELFVRRTQKELDCFTLYYDFVALADFSGAESESFVTVGNFRQHHYFGFDLLSQLHLQLMHQIKKNNNNFFVVF